MDVLLGIISEDVAYKIPMDIFKGIASVSSGIVLKRIDRYLNDTNAMPVVQRRVKEAYSEVTEKNDWYTSENILNAAQELSSLMYSDINASQSIETLQKWKDDIQMILDSPYAVAYIPPVKVESLKELCDVLVSRSKEIGPDGAYLMSLSDDLQANKVLFKDAPFKGYRGTPVKRIINDKTKYEIMLKGIDFLMERKHAGNNPQTWRYM